MDIGGGDDDEEEEISPDFGLTWRMERMQHGQTKY